MTRLRVSVVLVMLAMVPACDGGPSENTSAAAVAMPDRWSAEASSRILESGGNAVDAAITAAFTLAVTLPEAGNIGGGGFMLIHANGESRFLDYRETAPLAAHRDMYLDENGDVIEDLSLKGHLAVGVPGTVAGLWAAHQRFGTLPWKDLVAPAIALARDGFVAPQGLADAKDEWSPWFDPSSNFLQHFGSIRGGEVFTQPDLAATLERISNSGVDDFYRGHTADLIVAEIERGDGLITHEDLNQYEAVWREPLRADWHGYEILSAPPPSSGGFGVVQLLKMKEYLAEEFAGVAHNSTRYIHLIAEIEKRVFADRAEYMGDPDYVDVPTDALIDGDYLRARAAEVNLNEISAMTAVNPGLESGDTTHFSIVDRWGNAVSNTYTLNWIFGGGVVVEKGGFLLNNEMDDFSLKPGVPNFYGAVGSTANEIQPGKRMLSSMSPTILLKDGDVALVIGTPGGTTIFTSVFQTIVNIYEFGMSPLAAVGAARFHHQLLPPDLVTYSPNVPLPSETISSLADQGYRVEPHFFAFGDVQVIYHDGQTYQAASDPRNRGESRVLRFPE